MIRTCIRDQYMVEIAKIPYTDIAVAWSVDPPAVAYRPEIGAWTVRVADAGDRVRIVVFRGVDVGDQSQVYPVVGWENLAEDRRALQPNAKGTGLYTGTTPESVEVFADGPEREIGVFITPFVRLHDLLDRRDRGMLRDVKVLGRHLGRMIMSKLTSPERVVRNIDESYGQAPGVWLTPAPTVMLKGWLRRIKREGVVSRSAFPPGWLLWRDTDAPLERVGTVVRDGE